MLVFIDSYEEYNQQKYSRSIYRKKGKQTAKLFFYSERTYKEVRAYSILDGINKPAHYYNCQ